LKLDPFQQQAAFGATQYPGEAYYYGRTDYEASPLNRVLTGYAPGNSWVRDGHGVSSQYQINTAGDSVRIWNISFTAGSKAVNTGMYGPGQLQKTIITEEQSHQIVEYKDKESHVILKKVQLAGVPGSGHIGWLNTYYVYDSLDNLRSVLQPRAVELMDNTSSNWTVTQTIAAELCFRYEYDGRNRMIIKKVPGAGEVWMVYDARDRLVMIQDPVLRNQHKWLVSRYDALNRIDSTGLLTDGVHWNDLAYHLGQAAISTSYPGTAAGFELLSQNFYDDYTWASGSCGVLVPGGEARILREDGSEADVNEPGELYYRGANVALGYYANEEATNETFSKDGWLRTGDRFRSDGINLLCVQPLPLSFLRESPTFSYILWMCSFEDRRKVRYA